MIVSNRHPKGYGFFLKKVNNLFESTRIIHIFGFKRKKTQMGAVNFNVGDVVRVVDNIYGHEFEFGEVVIIEEKNEEDYKASNGCDYWWVRDSELALSAQNPIIISIGSEPDKFKDMKVYKYQDQVDFKYIFIMASSEQEAFNSATRLTSLPLTLVDHRNVDDLEKPVIIYSNVLPF